MNFKMSQMCAQFLPNYKFSQIKRYLTCIFICGIIMLPTDSYAGCADVKVLIFSIRKLDDIESLGVNLPKKISSMNDEDFATYIDNLSRCAPTVSKGAIASKIKRLREMAALAETSKQEPDFMTDLRHKKAIDSLSHLADRQDHKFGSGNSIGLDAAGLEEVARIGRIYPDLFGKADLIIEKQKKLLADDDTRRKEQADREVAKQLDEKSSIDFAVKMMENGPDSCKSAWRIFSEFRMSIARDSDQAIRLSVAGDNKRACELYRSMYDISEQSRAALLECSQAIGKVPSPYAADATNKTLLLAAQSESIKLNTEAAVKGLECRSSWFRLFGR